MHFTKQSLFLHLALLTQLASSLALPQRTIVRVKTVVLKEGESPPTPAPVVQYKVADNSDDNVRGPGRQYNVVKVVKQEKVSENQDQDQGQDRSVDNFRFDDNKDVQDSQQPDQEDQEEDERKRKEEAERKRKEEAELQRKKEAESQRQEEEEKSQQEEQTIPKEDTTPKEDTAEKEDTSETSTPSGGDSPPDAMKVVLDKHNEYRKKHKVGPLTWDSAIAAHAKKDNDRITCSSLTHSDDKAFGAGENLASGTGIDAEGMVKMWYDEVASYNFGSGGFSMGTGHFTQLVWKGTTLLGCDLGCDGKQLRCQYKEPGNMQGAFQQNVLA